jgi:prepilin-type N-terminal cleavage/methylation domain-containing protein
VRSQADKQGYTLVELIVAMAVLSILAAIAVPRYFDFTDQARIKADLATVRMLNRATTLYRYHVTPPDPFTDATKNNQQLLQELVDGNFYSTIPEPQKNGAEFIWHRDTQEWLYSVYEVAENPLKQYLFSKMTKDSFIFNTWGGGGGSSWSINEEGLYVTGKGNHDLLFIGNNKNEYTLTTKFRLNDNPGDNGGLGVFFETQLNQDNNNRDTGYILQFDRGLSEIVLRKRIDGNESGSSDMLLARIGNRSTSTVINNNIPYKTDSTWWEAEKELSISVQESTVPGKKLLTVSLDGEVLLKDFQIESDIQASNNHTGFRAWNNSPATIYDLTVE